MKPKELIQRIIQTARINDYKISVLEIDFISKVYQLFAGT